MTFSVQIDKKMTTARDVALDTDPHLLFEHIDDLYDKKGQLNDKYKYLLQLNKNRGVEGKLN